MITNEQESIKTAHQKNMKSLNVVILIDGSNFYFKLKDLGLQNLLNFDFSGFVQMLAGKGNKIIHATYYVGKVRTDGSEKSRKFQADQQKLLGHLKKHKVRYSLGYLLKSDGRYHEKGVDVAIAVDMLIATYEKLCDQIILVSSDTDLLPAILKSKEKGMFIGADHYITKPFEPEELLTAVKTHLSQ